jgi:protein-tyrosine phosphatase
MSFLSIFKKNKKGGNLPPFDFGYLVVDMHNHLLPGIDDGSPSMDHTIGMLLKFHELGYKKIIFTPHVMQDCYPNTPEIIEQKLIEVKNEIQRLGILLEVTASAEYNIEDTLLEKIKDKNLVAFPGNYILFEYSFFTKPLQSEMFIFELIVKGYKPIIAHFERYPYYFNQPEIILSYKKKGVLIQLNLLSIIGHYGPEVQKQAFWLIDNGYVDFVATDCHRIDHLEILQRNSTHPYFHKLKDLNLLNQHFWK